LIFVLLILGIFASAICRSDIPFLVVLALSVMAIQLQLYHFQDVISWITTKFQIKQGLK
jgi:hypothetical protein